MTISEAEQKLVIEVEKLLCEKLQKKWSAAGMSIQTLIDELADKNVKDAERYRALRDHGRVHDEGICVGIHHYDFGECLSGKHADHVVDCLIASLKRATT